VHLPLRVHPTVNEIGTSQVQYSITVKAGFNPKLSATNVVLRIPTPLNTAVATCKTVSGKAKYVPSENVMVWKYVINFPSRKPRSLTPLLGVEPCRIPRIQGGSEATLTAAADLAATTTRQAWARPPIDVDFQVLMFTASGLLVRFLKVYEKSGYHSVKWVRYLTRANGSYQIRVRIHLSASTRF
jgi:AP-2 complex subunit mu-1